MATTYLEAVNKVLVDSNEVKLTSANFASAVGVHESVKNFINDAYLEICAEEIEWPFLSTASSNTYEPQAGNTVIESSSGFRWYQLKTGSTSIIDDYAKVDWDSFYITTRGATGRTAPYTDKNLTFMSFDHWNQELRKNEDGAIDDASYGTPCHVIASQDGRFFGLSPLPDGAYKVYFTAWVRPSRLSTHSDPLLIPDMYMPVLYNRARYYINFFKKDYQEATLADRAYEKGLRTMRRGLISRPSEYMRDDRRVLR